MEYKTGFEEPADYISPYELPETKAIEYIISPKTVVGLSDEEVMLVLTTLLEEIEAAEKTGIRATIAMGSFMLIDSILATRLPFQVVQLGLKLFHSYLKVAENNVIRQLHSGNWHIIIQKWFDVTRFYETVLSCLCLKIYRRLLKRYTALSLSAELENVAFLHVCSMLLVNDPLARRVHVELLKTVRSAVGHITTPEGIEDMVLVSSLLAMTWASDPDPSILNLWITIFELTEQDTISDNITFMIRRIGHKYKSNTSSFVKFLTFFDRIVLRKVYEPTIDDLNTYCRIQDEPVRCAAFILAGDALRMNNKYCALMDVYDFQNVLKGEIESEIFANMEAGVRFLVAYMEHLGLENVRDDLKSAFVAAVASMIDNIDERILTQFIPATVERIAGDERVGITDTLEMLEENDVPDALVEILDDESMTTDAEIAALIVEILEHFD